MREMKTAALIGLGAIGGFVAPGLQRVLGENFRVIAGGARKERLETEGCVINDKTYHFHIVDPEEETGYADFVIFATKNTQIDQAIQDVKNQIGPDTIVMSLLNGVTSEEKIGEVYDPANILTTIIRLPSINQGGRITYPEGKGMISFGEDKNLELSEKVLAVKDLFDKAEIKYEIPEDMQKVMWTKYMTNVSENQLCAVLGTPYKGFHVSDFINNLREDVAREVIAVAQKKGIDLTEEDLIKHRSYIMGIIPHGRPSTLQDIQAKRKTEVEAFAGDMIRMGKEVGVATPYNHMLYHMICALEEKNEGKFEV